MNVRLWCGSLFLFALGVSAQTIQEVGNLEEPASFRLARELRRREIEEVRALEGFPLVAARPAHQRVELSLAEIENRLAAASFDVQMPAEMRRSVTSLPVLRNQPPHALGDWIPMSDGSVTYLLTVRLERAERVRVRLAAKRPMPGAVAIGYAMENGRAEDVVGPVSMQPADGATVLLPSIGGSEVHIEVRGLAPEVASAAGDPPFLIADVQYYAPGLNRYFGYEGEAFDCPSYQDVNCVSGVSSVKSGVVRLGIDAGGGTGTCTGAILRDSESTTDIPYILTAGHCVEGSLAVTEVYFWDESASCNSSSAHSWWQRIAPPIFELGYQNLADCQLDADWALLRFNLAGEVSHAPTFLDAKTAVQPFGRKVYQVHHPSFDRKKFSQGDLSTNHTYVQELDYDNGNWSEGGSSGSPIFDSTDLRIIGVFNCSAECSSVFNADMTKYGHVSSQITRFLSPALATPSIVSVSAPSSSPSSTSFLVTITVRNGGTWTSTDGHIHIALPTFTEAGDAGRVSLESKSSDLTYEEYPAGFSGLGKRNGAADPSANYLHIESRDGSWSPNEENFITLRITPKSTGSLPIWYRAAMRSQNDYYYNTPSDASYDVLDSDQQWPLNRRTVNITSGSTAPSVSTGSASSVGTTTAMLGGSVTPNGASTNAWFEWGLTTSYGNTTPQQGVGSGTSSVPYSANVSGLSCNTTYHFRAFAGNTNGTVSGIDRTFTTQQCAAVPPSVTTNAASGVGSDAATLNGSVNPNGSTTSVWFEWGLTTSYGNNTPPQQAGSGSSTLSYSSALSGLGCNTTYHFRAIASSIGGAVAGIDRTFTTGACAPSQPPAVGTDPATSVTASSATLHAHVNPNGSSTSAWFEWGPSTSYGNTTPPQDMGPFATILLLEDQLSGLSCNTTYHYRAVATNGNGTSFGGDQTFTTGACTGGGGGLKLYLIEPCRLTDTRVDFGPLQHGIVYGLQLASYCGIPMSAVAVSVNMTVTQATGAGFMTVWPWNLAKPGTSNISFNGNRTRSNNAILMLATDGFGDVKLEPNVAGGGTLHLIVDVTGYFQ